VNAIAEPPGLWHESLGKTLARIASVRPRAIGLDFPLPDRSYDTVKAGVDRALFVGLAAAIQNGPFVATLNIDARTRAAKRIHTPFLALLGESRLGIGLVARDADGVTRRFSLLIPTEDGGFPTLTGRLCRALGRDCGDGLIDYSRGPPLRYVPMKNILEGQDRALMERLFRDRIVLIGETQPFGDRVNVPVNLAGWEPAGRDTPGVVVHALSLRTALSEAAPQEASRPLVVLLLSAAALLYLMRDWRLALAGLGLAGAGFFVVALMALHAGTFVPLAPVFFTLVVAWIARAAGAWRSRRRRTAAAPNITHST
jgi:CHASE2 domain-containing sensor protein